MKRFMYPNGVLIFISIISLYVSVYAGYWVGERYFFDKLFYQKSAAHGYFIPNKPFNQYGRRSKDLIALRDYINKGEINSKVLGLSTQDLFTVVVIGDSYVWGQGIKDKDRFTALLEMQLNKITPSKVISLGNPGDDIYDYYIHFRASQKIWPKANLFIFSLVDNDLIINPRSDDESLKSDIASSCKPIIFNVYGSGEIPGLYDRLMNGSYNDANGNICFFRQLVSLLPKDQALYFDTQFGKSDMYLTQYLQPLIESGFRVISPNYVDLLGSYDAYVVSKAEGHPSRHANQVFADVLFEEIQSQGYLKKYMRYSCSGKYL